MKKLNKKATEVFAELLNMIKCYQYMNIRFDDPNEKDTHSPFMPLTLERLEVDIETPYGIGELYSLCHFYIQNGDLMQDPEMGFIIIDHRKEDDKDLNLLNIYPYLYVQANLGIHHQSVLFENNQGSRYNKEFQRDQAFFANKWLMDIKQNGYLNDKTFKKFQ